MIKVIYKKKGMELEKSVTSQELKQLEKNKKCQIIGTYEVIKDGGDVYGY